MVDRSLDAFLAKEHIEQAPAVRERIAVCVSSNPAAQYLVARASRMAQAISAEFYIIYVDVGRDTDPTPLVGWAGWDQLDAARALAATYEQRRAVDGWSGERLVPILAGLAELVPWLRQSHNDVDPATGVRLGDFFAEFVATESAAQGVGADELAAWRPPQKARGRGRGVAGKRAPA